MGNKQSSAASNPTASPERQSTSRINPPVHYPRTGEENLFRDATNLAQTRPPARQPDVRPRTRHAFERFEPGHQDYFGMNRRPNENEKRRHHNEEVLLTDVEGFEVPKDFWLMDGHLSAGATTKLDDTEQIDKSSESENFEVGITEVTGNNGLEAGITENSGLAVGITETTDCDFDVTEDGNTGVEPDKPPWGAVWITHKRKKYVPDNTEDDEDDEVHKRTDENGDSSSDDFSNKPSEESACTMFNQENTETSDSHNVIHINASPHSEISELSNTGSYRGDFPGPLKPIADLDNTSEGSSSDEELFPFVLSPVIAAKEDFLRLQCDESDRKIDRSKQQHQKKIDDVESSLKAMQGDRNLSLHEFQVTIEKKDVLREKLKELQQQKLEFLSATNQLKKKLLNIPPGNEMKQEAAAIRRKVGLEMAKLSAALPIYARRSDIVETVAKNQVCVVLGETGSGKSTQLVQYLHDAGFANTGTIVCTQPRKVAALSLAKHVAREMGSSVGKLVGYQVGSSKVKDEPSKILFMTDHTLLNDCIRDPGLQRYSCVIIDEAHERTIYTDLLIGMIKRCLKDRPDLRLIITSATIDPDIFIKYFDGCPLVKVSGRIFPVEVNYIEVANIEKSFVEEAARMALKVHKEESEGDILVFLTSPIDIERACTMTKKVDQTNAQVLQLHGRLPPEEQQLVFEAADRGKRKIIYATNVAETSLTIPGIKYVIDTGLAKEKVYDGARNRSSLEIRYISKSSADQRKGRAGRTQSGKCYRLYSAAQYNNMGAVSTPEILRVHLGQALMKLMELGVADTLSFEFVQAPPKEAFTTAKKQLEKLGAVQDGVLTDLGKKMAIFPLEPRLAKLVLEAVELGIPFSGVVVAALCTLSGSLFFRAGTEEQKSKADKLKVPFCDVQGDVLTELMAYREWDLVAEKEKSKWCMQNSFNAKSMKVVRDTVKEIRGVLSGEFGVKVEAVFEEERVIRDIVPKLLLKCFCDNLAFFSGYGQAGYYLCPKGQHGGNISTLAKIHPSSAFKFLAQNPQWVVYNQVLTTSETFILNVTSVAEEWVKEMIAEGLLDFDITMAQEKQLEVELTGRVGKCTGRRLAGKQFSQLKELQKQIRNKGDVELAFIDLNLDIGRLQLIGCHCYSDDIWTVLKKKVDAQKTELSGCLEEHSLVKDSRVRLVLGSGAKLKYLLMPSDFRSVLLSNVPDELSKVDVLEKCNQIGTVVDCFQFRVSGKRNAKWGKVTFAEPTIAKIVTEDRNLLPFQASPDVGRHQQSQSNNLEVRVEWCRRQPKGIAYVGFTDDEDAEMARSQLSFLYVCQTMIDVRPSRKHLKEIEARNLPQEVKKEHIKAAIKDKLGNVELEKVVIPRNPHPTMTDDANDLQRQLTEMIRTKCKSKFNVCVLKPSEKAEFYRSYVSFADVAEGMQVVESMNGIMEMRNQLLHMTPMIRTSLTVRKEIFDVTQKRLNEIILAAGSNGVTVTKTPQRCGDQLIQIEANDMREAALAVSRLQIVIRGLAINISSHKALWQFVQPGCSHWLKALQGETKTLIQIDRRLSRIIIFGEEQQQNAAKQQIDDYVQQCDRQEVRNIVLKGDDLPVGMMKQLFVLYGVDLSKLQEKTKLAFMEIDVKKHVLYASGSPESLDLVKSEIDELQQRMEQEGDHEVSSDVASLGECPICLCPTVSNDCYILECCGHPCCKACILSLVKSAIESRNFPLLCAADGCEQPLFVCDTQEILKLSKLTWQDLQTASLEAFVRQHHEEYKYCITPNCPMVYCTSQDGKVFTCDVCRTPICTTCHAEYHHGISCKMFQISKGTEKIDPLLTKWVLKDPDKRSLCPTCSLPIEKIEGCQNMRCTSCGGNFCFRCKKAFSTEDDVYHHLRKEHGGYY